MGLAKYFEDDCRIYSDRLYSIGLLDLSKYRKMIAEFKCPYCNGLFSEKDNMFSHIRKAHNINEPHLFINGFIVNGQDTIYVPEVRSASIQMYGFDKVVTVGAKTILTDSEDNIDITGVVNESLTKKRFCEVLIGNNSYRIERYSLYSVDQNRLNEFVSEWEDNLRNGRVFKPFYIDSKEVNGAEAFYLKGVFNYFVACQAKENDKIQRYYEANSILKQFMPTNSLGLCIQKIIAFKLNWVRTLDKLCEDYDTKDAFYSASSFFRNINSDRKTVVNQAMNSIFMEDELLEVLNAILAFNRRDYDSVNDYLSLHEPNKITDNNLKDKILLLKYHMLMLNGKCEEARYTLEEIHSDEFEGFISILNERK